MTLPLNLIYQKTKQIQNQLSDIKLNMLLW